jgi:flavin reductase (DIM6/NTAB) family NADH-FMN oxidoreductase RutF
VLDPNQPIDLLAYRRGRGDIVEKNSDRLPEALRRLPRGVSIVTFAGAESFGLTATSVSSLGLEPPTILVSIDKRAPLSRVFLASRRFGISVLAAGHDSLADKYSGGAAIAEGDLRSNAWVSPATGVHLLADAVAGFDCELDDAMECQSHAIVVGRVHGVITPGRCSALIYWRGAYDHLGWTEDEISRAIGMTPTRVKSSSH